MLEIEVERPIGAFKILYDLPKDIYFIICIGGRGGCKTYEISKWVAFNAIVYKKRCVILRDEHSKIKQSILDEIWTRYDTANENGILDKYFAKNEYELKDKFTNKTLIYTQGFRASSNKKKTNLKGSADIDIAIIEEGEDIRDKDKFYTFIDSLRKEGCIIVFMLNTPDVNHFILKNYYNLSQVEDGYFRINPKKMNGFLSIFTTYHDNPFLPDRIIKQYESYGDILSPIYDKHYYMTSILGYASLGRKGQVHTKVKPITLKEYMSLPYKEIYGQDFGTSSPAGLVGVKLYKNNSYCRQLNYLPMPIKSIGINYCKLGFTDNDKIIVDNAEPQWRKLRDGFMASELSDDEFYKYPQLRSGFNVFPCSKGIKNGISLMNSMNLYAVEESLDLWNEINNRVYSMNKNGEYTDEPEPGYDHLIDPWMYVIVDQRGWKSNEEIVVNSN